MAVWAFEGRLFYWDSFKAVTTLPLRPDPDTNEIVGEIRQEMTQQRLRLRFSLKTSAGRSQTLPKRAFFGKIPQTLASHGWG